MAKRQFIVDNANLGPVDIPSLHLTLVKGEYDVDLCERLGLSYDEVLSNRDILVAIRNGWISVKEGKNGKRITFEKFVRVSLKESKEEITAYLDGVTNKKPTGLVAKYGYTSVPVVTDAEEFVGGIDTKQVTKADLEAMAYPDLMKTVAELELSTQKSNKKVDIIEALCIHFGLIEEPVADTKGETHDTPETGAVDTDSVDNEDGEEEVE